MSPTVRVVDAGLQPGRLNIAIDQAIIDLHQAGAVPDTLRFIHFSPTALVGRHQDLSAEIDLDYCRAHGIGVGRRITGGGAIYLDEGQLGWALVLRRDALGTGTLGEAAARICHAVAAGLGRLGVDARFRPRNDIEVDGRKISGTGGFHDGDTLLYQGTVLVDADTTRMLGALRVPRAKLERHQADSAARRVVGLRELLGADTPPMGRVQQALAEGLAAGLGLRLDAGTLTDAEHALARDLHQRWIGRDDFVAEIDGAGRDAATRMGEYQGAGGRVAAYLRREGPHRRRIGHLLLTGDFFVAPPRLVFDLEAHLRGTDLADLRANVAAFFAGREAGTISITAGDFCTAIERAADVAGTD